MKIKVKKERKENEFYYIQKKIDIAEYVFPLSCSSTPSVNHFNCSSRVITRTARSCLSRCPSILPRIFGILHRLYTCITNFSCWIVVSINRNVSKSYFVIIVMIWPLKVNLMISLLLKPTNNNNSRSLEFRVYNR